MLAGALIGALLVLQVNLVLPLVIAAALTAVTAMVAHTRSAGSSGWVQPSEPN
jgi:hypothetical protein